MKEDKEGDGGMKKTKMVVVMMMMMISFIEMIYIIISITILIWKCQ